MQIQPAKSLKGEITVPGDKSISHRAIILGSIAHGMTEIEGFLMGEDCLNTIDCFRKLGISIEVLPDSRVKVHGKGMHGLQPPSQVLYTGNSGTTTRLMLGLLAGQSFESTLDGDASIRKRPMVRVTYPLCQMGAKISGDQHGELCPLTITGQQLHAIQYRLPIASAQVKSALLLASLYASGETYIIEPAKSRDHTELMLNAFGCNIKVNGLTIRNSPVPNLSPQRIIIPGDISSAAYFMVAGLIVPNSEITLRNVGINITRTGIIDALTAMGGKISVTNCRLLNNEPVADITVFSSTLSGITIEGDIIPRLIDEIPVLAIAAAAASGTTVVRNAEELKVKESNRIQAVVTELSKAGVDITETEDGMIIKGGKPLKGTRFESYYDHRIAMAMSIAALISDSNSHIHDAQTVEISFPGFFDKLKNLQM